MPICMLGIYIGIPMLGIYILGIYMLGICIGIPMLGIILGYFIIIPLGKAG